MSDEFPNPLTTLHIYTRVSSDRQEEEGTSLEEQKKLGLRTAESRSMKPVVWEEGSASSHHEGFTKRPQFLKVLDGVRNGQVKHLFVADLSRLSRNKQNSSLIEWELANHKVSLHTPAGRYELGDPQSDFLFGMLNLVSSYDNRLRMEKFRLGRFNKVSQGYWHGGPPPFGYSIVEKKLVVNDDESKWVRFIFEKYAEGVSTRDIRNELAVAGVKTRRGNDIWSLGSVESLLRNKHYDGWYEVRDSKDEDIEPYRVECPRIVPEETFVKVKVRRSQRSRNRVKNSNEKNFYFLKGLLKCGDCGRNFHGRVQKRQYDCYYCPSKERRWVKGQTEDYDACKNSRYLRIEETDQLIWDTVVQTLRDSHIYKERIKSAVLGQPKITEEETEKKRQLEVSLKYLRTQLSDFKTALVKIDTDLVLGKGDAEHLQQVKEGVENAIDSQIVQIENTNFELEELEKGTRWVDWVKKFGNQLDDLSSSSPTHRKDFLMSVVREVMVKTTDKQTHNITINFHVPYYGDRLVYEDPNDKSLGYSIEGGSTTLEMEVNTSKKTYTRVEN